MTRPTTATCACRPDVLAVASSEALVAGLRASEQATNLGSWLDYHARRYGW